MARDDSPSTGAPSPSQHPEPLGDDRPYLARSEPLPRRLDDVTPEWLTRLLANRYPGIVVRDLEAVGVDNTHTTKVRLRWDLDDVGRAAGIPEGVCLKCNWSGLRTGDICELEARFYHALGDALDGLVPATFYADWDDDGRGNGIVVMEDLGATPGAFGASDDHLGVDGVAAGLETLARIHAASWDDARLRSWPWLARNMDTANDTDQVILYWNYIRYNLADPAYATAVPAWVHETPERLGHALDELAAYERDHAGPVCVVHGDAHQGNSFLRADGQRIWLDWQMVRRGRPLRDVEYFLVSSLAVDDRRAAARDLVEHYRRALIAGGVESAPSRDDAWQQFVRWPAYGTECWLGNVNQWGQHSGAEMVRRHFAAAEDYGTYDLLTADRSRRRDFDPSGAYRLPHDLQRELDARLGGDGAPPRA